MTVPRGIVVESGECGPVEPIPVRPTTKGEIMHRALTLKDGESFAVRGLPWKNLYDRLTWVKKKYDVRTRIERTGEEMVFRVCLQRKRTC